jgi:hypothetical protein
VQGERDGRDDSEHYTRSPREDTSSARGNALARGLRIGFQLRLPVALQFCRSARRPCVLPRRGVLFQDEPATQVSIAFGRPAIFPSRFVIWFRCKLHEDAGFGRSLP